MATEPPVLLFIHGFPLDGTLWEMQQAGLDGIIPTLAPDLRGFGKDRRPLPEAMRMEDHALDLRSLLDGNGMERVVLCGLSMGGYIAMAFAEQWPQRVVGLVLANTRASADDAAARASREQSARNALEKGMSVIARSMVPMLLTPKTRRERPGLARDVEHMIARQSPLAAAASSRGMALRPDRMAFLRRTTIPTLVITGDADELMPLSTSQVMADAIGGSSLVVIPGAAHLSNLEAPKAFNTALEAFIRQLPTQ